MAKKEKFGKFVLLEEVETSGLGTEYRSAKLGAGGLEKIVTVMRLGGALSANPETAKALMEQAKVAAQLQTPNILKILGIGKVEGTYYISHEFIEGKSLKSIYNRCRQESFPLSVDHALLIASKICSALEYAHGRKIEGVGRYYHGFLAPGSVVVSYEGELRVRGFGYWLARIRDAGIVADEDLLYLAPEQVATGAADPRSDIFAVGAILFEALTGHPLFEGGRSIEIPGRLATARLQNPTSDDDALPRPIAEILARALAVDPAARYGEVQELRKAIDTLLFSGDFTPTTFNLAFFMHSLFREDIERESKALKQEREASYFDYLTEEPAKAPLPAVTPLPQAVVTAAPPVVPAPSVPPPAVVPPMVTPAPRSLTPAPVSVPTPAPFPRALTPLPPSVAPEPAEPVAARMRTPVPFSAPVHAPHAPAHVSAPPRELPDLSGPILSHAEAPPKSRTGMIVAVVLVVLLGATGAFFFLRKPSAPATPPPTTLSPEMEAILKKQRELEEKLQAFETEKAAATAAAQAKVEEEMQKKAKAAGLQVNQAELEKAKAEAARKAAAEAEKRAQEEKARLAEEEAKIAADKKRQEEEDRKQEAARMAALQTPVPPPTTAATPPPTPVPAATIYGADDPGIVPPTRQCPPVIVPPIAKIMKVWGDIPVLVMIDETGRTSEVRAVGGPEQLRSYAVDHIKKCKFRPGTRDGVPVKVNWVVRISYRP